MPDELRLFLKERFGVQGEVKSTTFHGLSVRKEDGRWKAQVILDV